MSARRNPNITQGHFGANNEPPKEPPKEPPIINNLSDDEREEYYRQYREDYQKYQEGKLEDTVLINGLMNSWDADAFLKNAKRRGRSWRFLTKLVDQLLQLEGYSTLMGAAIIGEQNVTKIGMDKTASTLRHIQDTLEEYIDDGGMFEDIFIDLGYAAAQASADSVKHNRSRYRSITAKLFNADEDEGLGNEKGRSRPWRW